MKALASIAIAVTLGAPVFPRAQEGGLLGIWRSAELNTGSTLQVEFVEKDGKVILNLFPSQGGKISGTPSTVETDFSPEAARKTLPGDPQLTIQHNLSFKKVTYEVSLTQNGLRMEGTHVYDDYSRRGIRKETLNFVRGSYREASEQVLGHGVPETGWLGAWKNRDPGTRGIAQLLINDVDPVMMSTWGIVGQENELSSKRGSYVELPLTAEEAHASEAKPEIEAMYDLGWAKETFRMKLHEDGITLVLFMDYTDPDRRDQTIEYEFVRGVWSQPGGD